ncbi:hypothetical protein [Chryseobacterium sp.]|uniref:hypothetical protein n=1 Tax=Chryseobacterium sp. TaxID=1871047 RepID=UPI00388E1EEE
MSENFSLLFALLFALSYSQTKIFGTIRSEGDKIITSVLVVNTANDQKTMSNERGEFSIDASIGDEIRFSKFG